MISSAAQLYCKDDISKIENYEQAMNDTEHVWDCHHRLELTIDGKFAHSIDELQRLDMYFKRPYFELIFLKSGEHRRLHNNSRPHSLESKAKMSKSHMGHRGYNAKKRAFTDGVKNVFAHECPAGFRPGWTWNPETRARMEKAHRKEKE